MPRCAAILPIFSDRIRCEREQGHDGEHIHEEPGYRRSWSDRLYDFMDENRKRRATQNAGMDDLYAHALPDDAPGAWVRAAIDRERARLHDDETPDLEVPC